MIIGQDLAYFLFYLSDKFFFFKHRTISRERRAGRIQYQFLQRLNSKLEVE